MSPFSPISFRTKPRSSARAGAAAALGLAVALAASAPPARAAINPLARGFRFVSLDGSYLAGLVAGAELDTHSSALFLTQALRADPDDPELLQRACIAQLSDGDMSDAFASARRLARIDENNGLVQLALGVRALQAKRYASARAHFEKSGASNDVTSNLLTAWSLAGAGDAKRAVDSLEKSTLPQFKAFVDYQEGLIDEYAGSVADARKHLKAAYDAAPSTLRIVDAWARFSDRTGDAAEAKRAYQALDKILPRHPLVQDALAKLAAGRKLAPLVRTPQAGAAEVLYGLGAAGGLGPDTLPAMIYLRLGLYLAPRNDLATLTLADLYERLKQHQAAIDLYRSIPAGSPLRLDADVQVALIEDELGRTDQATKDLNAVVAQHPNDVDALTALGNLQRAHKRFAASVATYSKALAAAGGPAKKANWNLLYFRGISEEQSKSWPAAQADFEQALKLYPDQPLVLNYLAYSWLDRGTHYDQAFKMLSKAAELRPDDGYIVDSLGWAFYKLGKYSDAEHVLERAIQLEPGDPTVNEHLGDVYWRLGYKLDAQFQWNHARDFGPDKQDLPRILNKIAHGLPAPSAKDSPAPQQPKSGG